MKPLAVLLILALSFAVIHNALSDEYNSTINDSQISELFRKWLPYLPNAIKLTTSLYSATSKISELKNTQCFEDIKLILLGLSNYQEWALKMFDASAKIANGKDLFEGNAFWIGSSSLCHNITSPFFETHFCKINFIKEFPALQISLCIPSSCQEKYFNDIPELELQHFEFNNKRKLLKGPLFEVICLEEFEKTPTDQTVKIMLIICSCLIAVVIFATGFEILWKSRTVEVKFQTIATENIKTSIEVSREDKKEKELDNITEIILCFSALTNGRQLINMKTKENHFACLDGVRCISFFYVVYVHIHNLLSFFADNPLRFADFFTTYPFVSYLKLGFLFSVDSFFILSSFLSTYSLLKVRRPQQKMIFWSGHVVKRYFRMSPAFYFALLFQLLVYNKLQFKNFNTSIAGLINECRNFCIWNKLFYIGNFFENECFGIAWYLYNDMQFHFLLPVFLLIIKRSKVLGLTTLFATILTSIFVTASLFYMKHILYSIGYLQKDFFRTLPDVKEFYDIIYIKPYCRITPFIAGILCAWFYYETKDKIKLTKIKVMAWFCFSFVCFYVAVFYEYHFSLNLLQLSIYQSIRSGLWSLALCIIIYLCCCKHGGLISSFLCWPGWSFLSQLSYCSYLVHWMILFYFLQEFFISDHLQLLEILRLFFNVIQIVIVGGFLLHMTIEAPCRNLQAIFLKRKNKFSED